MLFYDISRGIKIMFGLACKSEPKYCRRRVADFTLIELMVVISIIAILASILMPALKKARDVSQSTVCLNNQKQIGTCFQLYLDDYNNWLPVAEDPGGLRYWWFEKISVDYLNINWFGGNAAVSKSIRDSVLFCPSSTYTETHPALTISYSASSAIIGGMKYRKYKFSKPSVTGITIDAKTGIEFDGASFYNTYDRRHNKGANALFLDWHAGWIANPQWMDFRE